MISGNLKHTKIAIIGAGWSGLSAAAYLAPHAHVTLFEAGRQAGGRARSTVHQDFSFTDNGQHLLIGAYHSIFSLLKYIDADIQNTFIRQPLQWFLADGLRFQATAYLPAPFNLLTAIVGAQHCTLPEKWALLRHTIALQRWHYSGQNDCTVAQWLTKQNVSYQCITQFWQPLVLGALNTPLQEASLRTLYCVLADGIWARRSNSDYYVPRIDLNTLFTEPVLQYIQRYGAHWRNQTRVEKLVCEAGKVRVQDELFDAVIVAVAPYHVASLLPESLASSVRNTVNTLKYHAISTVYLRYAAPLHLPALMTGFAYGTAQWLIDRAQLNGTNEIAATISVSERFSGNLKTSTDWVNAVHADVLRICPNAGKPVAQHVIHEKRATIAATVARSLPDMTDLNAANIWLAGDWLHTRYPATLEAAVQSGQEAAKQLSGSLK